MKVPGKLYFDGSGNGRYSFILYYGGREVSRGTGEAPTDSSKAEYYGLINGLKEALALGISRIVVYGDCKTVVEQVKGRVRTESKELIPLMRRSRILLSNFETAEVHWIPREKNKADEVVREKVKIKDSDVKKLRNGIYLVSGNYIVNLHNNTCTCPEFVMKNRDYLTGKTKKVKDCIHLKAVKKQAKEEVVK